jgi:hypothetical protein
LTSIQGQRSPDHRTSPVRRRYQRVISEGNAETNAALAGRAICNKSAA